MSKQTPLPTSVSVGPSSPHRRSSRRGARSDARPTAWIIGKFRSSRSSPRMAACAAPCCCASATNASSSSSGPRSEAGVLMRSRVRHSPAAIDFDPRGIAAFGRHQLRLRNLAFPIAVEAILPRSQPSAASSRSAGKVGPTRCQAPSGSAAAAFASWNRTRARGLACRSRRRPRQRHPRRGAAQSRPAPRRNPLACNQPRARFGLVGQPVSSRSCGTM